MLRDWRFYTILVLGFVIAFAVMTRDVWLGKIQREVIVNGRVYDPQKLFAKPFEAIKTGDFEIKSLDEVDFVDSELVLGVEINGESRAYTLAQLSGPEREIINDTLGNTLIAATW